MSKFTDQHSDVLEEYGKDFFDKFGKVVRLSLSRFKDGVVIVVSDQEGSKVYAGAIRRENWRVLFDLMPDETIEYPLMTWNEFLIKSQQEEDATEDKQ